MSMLISAWVCALCLGLATLFSAPGETVINGDFKQGLEGWRVGGQVVVSGGQAEFRSAGARIEQDVKLGGLEIVNVQAKADPQADGTGSVTVQCLDGQEHVVLQLEQPFGKDGQAGIYFKTQATTQRVRISVARTGVGGSMLRLVHVEALLEELGRSKHAPELGIDEAMRPIWQGDRVSNETALLYSVDGGAARGKLLFQPTHIEKVTDSTGRITYSEGKDFRIVGSTIEAAPGSGIPRVSNAEVPKGEFPWLNLAGKHVLVTYRHGSRWAGPTATPSRALLPKTFARLEARKGVHVVAYGDSITLGLNVSGYRGVPPHLPTWPELFTREVGKRFAGARVDLTNTALGGMTAEWGKENATSLVGSLHPNLVLIAFGMNDFWSYSPAQFKENIAAIRERVLERNPECEFILIASMRFDPAYTADPQYVTKLPAYATELRSLVRPGTALLDMTSMSEALYAAKSAKDLETDPMHPADFLARWYAQSLVAMFDGPARAEQTFFVDPQGDDSNSGLSREKAWKSLSKLSTVRLVAGDHVELAPGASFAGNIALSDEEFGTAGRPIVIEARGERATIVSPEAPAIAASRGGLEIRNLNLVGKAAAKRDGQEGILLSAKGGQRERHVVVDHVSVKGFGSDGVSIKAPAGSAMGWSDVVLTHVDAVGNFGTGIISSDGISYLGSGFANEGFLISDCSVEGSRSGSGLILSGVNHAVVEYCRVSDSHGAGGGVGMWAWCARDVKFRYCIAERTRTNNGGDGGGFDLDGGCEHCVVERCVSFENDGPGGMHCDFPTAPKTQFNSIRECVSVNDGRKSKGDSVGFGFVTWGSGLDDCSVSRNLAVVTEREPGAGQFGVFFATWIDGSKGPRDVLHVKNCVVEANLAFVRADGYSFVESNLPHTTPAQIRFEKDRFFSTRPTPMVVEAKPHVVLETIGAWQKRSGEEQPAGTKVSSAYVERLAKVWLGVCKDASPRDLPRFFRSYLP